MAYFNMDHDLDLIEVRESPSVTIERNHDGTLTMWPVIIAKFDTHLISDRFDELHMTPNEVSKVVNNVLERLNEEMTEYMANYVSEAR